MSKEYEIIKNKIIELMDIPNIMNLKHPNIYMLFGDINTAINNLENYTLNTEQEEVMKSLNEIEHEIHNQKATIYPNRFIDLMEIDLPKLRQYIAQPNKTLTTDRTLEELKLYKQFVKEFSFELVTERNSNDEENWEEEYLDQSGATDKALELFKKIKEIEGRIK